MSRIDFLIFYPFQLSVITPPHDDFRIQYAKFWNQSQKKILWLSLHLMRAPKPRNNEFICCILLGEYVTICLFFSLYYGIDDCSTSHMGSQRIGSTCLFGMDDPPLVLFRIHGPPFLWSYMGYKKWSVSASL